MHFISKKYFLKSIDTLEDDVYNRNIKFKGGDNDMRIIKEILEWIIAIIFIVMILTIGLSMICIPFVLTFKFLMWLL